MARHARAGEGRALPGPSLAAFPELATYVSRTPGRPANPTSTGRGTRASARIPGTALRAVLLGGLVAAAVALAAWRLLPYEALDAESFAQRFFVWEGMMWGFGIAGVLFGIASLLNASDLYSPRTLEQVRQQMADARRGRMLFSDVPAAPWALLVCGAALILTAVVTRSAMMG